MDTATNQVTFCKIICILITRIELITEIFEMERNARKRRVAQLSKAKKTEDPELPDMSSNDDNESNESVSSDLELQVEFEGKAIQEHDFDGIRQLLHQLFLKADVGLNELVELILSQNNVGSTIKLCAGEKEKGEEEGEEEEEEEEEEQVCGIATVINLTFHKEKACAKKLMEHLLSQSKEHNTASGHTLFSQLVKAVGGQLGLLIDARFLNIPPHLVIPLFKSLRSEMEEACDKGLPYSFQHYLVIARSHQLPSSPSTQQPKRTKKAKPSSVVEDKGELVEDKGELVFDHFECELMQQESVASFSYPVSEESDSVIAGTWSFDDQAMKPFRTVMVIPATTVEKVVVLLESAL